MGRRSTYLCLASVAALSTAMVLLWSTSARALTITPMPPTATQVSPTQETITWQTDATTTSDQVQYGLSYSLQWTAKQLSISGSPRNETVVGVKAVNAQRAFVATAPTGGTSVLYETTNGGTSWTERWSYTLESPGALEVDVPANRVYVGTANGFVHVLTLSGSSVAQCDTQLGITDMALANRKLWVVGLGTTTVKEVDPASCAVVNHAVNLSAVDPSATYLTDIAAITIGGTTTLWVTSNDVSIATSTNSGSTWSTAVLGTPGSPLGFEDIGAVSNARAYAVGRNGGIYLYSGGTWSVAPTTTSLDFLSLGVGSDSKIFAFGCCTGGFDYYSFSGDGSSWSSLVTMATSTNALAASFVTPNVGWLGGFSGRLALHSVAYPSSTPASNGTNHTATVSGLQEATYYHASAISNTSTQTAESGNFAFKTQELTITDPLGPTATTTSSSATITWNTPNQASLAADSRIYLSANPGWQSTSISGSSLRGISAVGDGAYLVGQTSNAIFRANGLAPNPPLSLIAPPGRAEGIVMVGNRGWAVGQNFIMRTNDAGAIHDGTSWVSQSNGVPSSTYFTNVTAIDDQHAWVVGDNIILRTTDGGSNWNTVLAPLRVLYDTAVVDALTLVAAGDNGYIHRSTDSGATWTQLPRTLPDAAVFGLSFASATAGWAAGFGGVIGQSIDGGKTWSEPFNATSCGFNTTTFYDVAAISPNDVWFVGSGGKVLHWTGAGSCPQTVLIGTATNLRSVDVDGANVWITGENGLVARYGVDTASSSYRSLTDASLTRAHSLTVNVPPLTPNTTYNYFVQSYDAAGYTAVSPLKTFTTQAVPQLQVTPSSLSFTATQGQNPAPQTFLVKDQNNGNIGGWNLSSTTAWLSSPGAVTPTSGPGTPSDTVSVTPNVAGLTVGTYTGTVTVNATDPGVDPTSTPKTVNVSLTITPPPKLTVSSTSLSFTAQENGSAPGLQTVDVTNGGGGTLTYTTDTGGTTWLSATPNVPPDGANRYATPSKVNVAPTTTALAPGTYNATITLDGGPGVDSSPQPIAVTYVITAAPRLQLTPGPNPTLAFTATQSSGTDPAPQDVVVQNAGGGAITWTATNPVSWITLTNSSDGNGPTTMRIQVRNVLAAGDYTAAITVTATTGGGSVVDSPQTIAVQFHVDPAPVLSVSKSSLTFTTTQGTNPPEQTFIVQSGAPAGWSGTTSVTPPLNWLSITPTTGTNYNDPNDPVHVRVDVAGLAVGTYAGTITISSSGAVPSSMTINVTLNVTAPPVLDVNPRSITVTTDEGTTATTQLGIFNNGGAGTTMNWDMAQPAATWVRLSLTASCAGPFGPISGALVGGQSVVVTVCIDTVNPTLLTPAAYASTLTINAPGAQPAAAGVNNVPVTLNVLADTTGPTVVAGSIIIDADGVCVGGGPPYYFGRIKWQTSEPADSRVEWGEQLVSGVPPYELGSLVRPEGLDTAAHTGGVVDHEVILDNLNGIVGGHTYYVRLTSMDRYRNVSPWTDHFEVPRSNEFLSFTVPNACDTTPPTNVILTVPPGTLSGTVNVNLSAEDQSRIDRFEIYEGLTPGRSVVATVAVPAAACFSTGPTFSCSVTYALDTRLLPDGQAQLYARAFDLAGNSADSPNVAITVNNAVPRVSNVKAVPSVLANGLWQALVTWDTDLPSNSLVDYGMEDDDGNFNGYTDQQSPDDSGRNDLIAGHQVTLTNLPAGHIFHYRVTSCSSANPTLCGN
ncbi:MAG: hypothetical protein HY567_01980 [Candidatus Kerfeldbacteria bacterium]|nr:hypothetical protein [Candidatus Kerfeldbacteria bacterium]